MIGLENLPYHILILKIRNFTLNKMASTSKPILAFHNQSNDTLKMILTRGLPPIVLVISSEFKQINQLYPPWKHQEPGA